MLTTSMDRCADLMTFSAAYCSTEERERGKIDKVLYPEVNFHDFQRENLIYRLNGSNYNVAVPLSITAMKLRV
jgi:hypothetical protein